MKAPNYPIKFIPILQERIWGGYKLHTVLGKEAKPLPIGESWEISTIPDNVSIVENGFLKGESLQDLIHTYKADFVGEKVYTNYGENFPLLIKFIDAKTDLSVQLHPNDDLAQKRHNCSGKEEMWYIMSAEKDSRLLFGFNQELSKDTYLNHLKNNTLPEVLHSEKIKEGAVYHIPAGRVHAIGSGVVLAEIQQSSDVTYRLYDWDRKDTKGKGRELHTEQALDAIDFSIPNNFKTKYKAILNSRSSVIRSPNFVTNILELNTLMRIETTHKDSFTIYMCVSGAGQISTKDFTTNIKMGETVLIPASVKNYQIMPESNYIKLLQVSA